PAPPYHQIYPLLPPPPELPHEGAPLRMAQRMVEEAKWSGELSGKDRTSLVAVCPITWGQNAQGQKAVTYNPLPYSVVRYFQWAVTDTGLQSTYVKGLLEALGNGYTLLSTDWKKIMCMILDTSPPSWKLRDRIYSKLQSKMSQEQLAKELLCGLQANSLVEKLDQDLELGQVVEGPTLDHILGPKRRDDPNLQIVTISVQERSTDKAQEFFVDKIRG
ncbi:hypothetical protein JRQ81_005020, partial [Phrynocephalus forsythii]